MRDEPLASRLKGIFGSMFDSAGLKISSQFGLNFTMIFRFLNRNLGALIRIRMLKAFKITLLICDATVS